MKIKFKVCPIKRHVHNAGLKIYKAKGIHAGGLTKAKGNMDEGHGNAFRAKALVSLLTGICVLFYGAFSPAEPSGAWWCTAFSIMCREAVDEPQGENAETQTLEYRCRFADWLQSFRSGS